MLPVEHLGCPLGWMTEIFSYRSVVLHNKLGRKLGSFLGAYKERIMKKHGWIYPLIGLTLAILACAVPAIGDGQGTGGPRLAGTITYQESAPVPQIDAKEAIQTYARDVLGLDIPDLTAAGKSGEVNLPISTLEGVEFSVGLAGTTYVGIWGRGAASLSFGDSAVSGDLFADVQDGSLGAFAVRVNQDFPLDAPTALGMILTTYPGINGYEYFETPVEDKGFEFYAGKAEDIRIQDWGVTLTGTTIRAGVKSGLLGGNSVVWVVVASGALATPLDQQGQ
jgi:hypothetical protein